MEQWLPLIFLGVMGLALLVYIILDGYDLGIGLLLPYATEEEKDQMIASIGPFWDANETWIVLGVGVLLIAFPGAQGVILTTLYLPVTIMLFGLILRGVSFDFRAKVKTQHKALWNRLFAIGSLVAATAQGWMLGHYVMGLKFDAVSLLFAFAIALTLPALYIMLGCAWLFMKAGESLQRKALHWAKLTFIPMGLGLFLVSIATPIASEAIAAKWFSLPAGIGLMAIPLACIMAYALIFWMLRTGDAIRAGYEGVVFAALVVICTMATLGLAYSIYPDIIIDRLSIEETVTSTAALEFTFYGVLIAVPMIVIYTLFIYRIFSGKVEDLRYE